MQFGGLATMELPFRTNECLVMPCQLITDRPVVPLEIMVHEEHSGAIKVRQFGAEHKII